MSETSNSATANFSADLLEEIKSRLPLPQYIGRSVKLERKGPSVKGCCPFHGEKSPSFVVYPGNYHCFGCGENGDIFAFVRKTKGGSFVDAVRELADEAGVTLPARNRAQAEAQAQTAKIKSALHDASKFYMEQLQAEAGAEARSYIAERGITDDDVANFRLGWAPPEGTALVTHLRTKGYSDDEIHAAGLARRNERGPGLRDFFFGRIMFPVANNRGEVLSFGGRALGAAQPKYINGTETSVYKKGKALYGLDRAAQSIFKEHRANLIEGNIDVVAMHRVGITNSVAPMGTAVTIEQIKLLWTHAKEVVICLDGDAPGIKAALKLAHKLLPEIGIDRRASFATMPEGEDPDSMISKGDAGVAAVRQSLDGAKPISDFLFEATASAAQLSTIEGRAAFRRSIREIVAAVTDREIAIDWEEAGQEFVTRKLAGATAAQAQVGLDSATTRILVGLVLLEPQILQVHEDLFAAMPIPAEDHEFRGEIVKWWRCSQGRRKEELILHLRQTNLIEHATDIARTATAQVKRSGAHVPLDALWENLFASRMGAVNLSLPPPLARPGQTPAPALTA